MASRPPTSTRARPAQALASVLRQPSPSAATTVLTMARERAAGCEVTTFSLTRSVTAEHWPRGRPMSLPAQAVEVAPDRAGPTFENAAFTPVNRSIYLEGLYGRIALRFCDPAAPCNLYRRAGSDDLTSQHPGPRRLAGRRPHDPARVELIRHDSPPAIGRSSALSHGRRPCPRSRAPTVRACAEPVPEKLRVGRQQISEHTEVSGAASPGRTTPHGSGRTSG